jgi:hypothetical protein
LRRVIPPETSAKRAGVSFAAVLQYVIVNAANCSRLMFEAAKREYVGDPAGCQIASYWRVCPEP